jgi:hypothetical protein
MPEQISSLNELLQHQLSIAAQRDQHIANQNASGTPLEIPETGKILSSAYEQLRKAAEYAEEHLLLQRAIKRFLKRNLFLTRHDTKGLGNELIVELVQAGYISGSRYSTTTANGLDDLFDEYMTAHGHLRQAHVDPAKAQDWVLAIAASEAESRLNPHNRQLALLYFAYQHFLQGIDKNQYADLENMESYELCVYIAVHQALLKSDMDIVRHELLSLYRQSPADTHDFIYLNNQIDTLFKSELTAQLKRVISRYGASFRILKDLLENRGDAGTLLNNREQFLDAFDMQTQRNYRQLASRLNRGLVKSIIFIFITKVIVGISLEVPYDLATMGYIAHMPLLINLIFPPLYMASLKLSMRKPSRANAKATRSYMDNLLYGRAAVQIQARRRRQSSLGVTLVYSLLFLIPIGVTVLIMQRLQFNIMQTIIFFVFFSTASFFGFRLSTMVRELEITTRQSGLFTGLRDFFYLPFIVVGQWLSQKYGKINAVGRFLDVAIELPLKSLLRLLRQWMRFLYEKHEDLY